MPAHFVFATDSHHHTAAEKDYSAPKMLTRSHEIHEALVPAINMCKPEFIVHGGDLLCTRFRLLDLPDLIQASFDRSSVRDNQRWLGEVNDRDTEVLIPRLQALWGVC